MRPTAATLLELSQLNHTLYRNPNLFCAIVSSRVEWKAVAHEFEWDGSLRDIYVQQATLEDWQAVLDTIRSRFPPPNVHDRRRACRST